MKKPTKEADGLEGYSLTGNHPKNSMRWFDNLQNSDIIKFMKTLKIVGIVCVVLVSCCLLIWGQVTYMKVVTDNQQRNLRFGIENNQVAKLNKIQHEKLVAASNKLVNNKSVKLREDEFDGKLIFFDDRDFRVEAAIVVALGDRPYFFLIFEDFSHDKLARDAIAGFDKVRTRIGTNKFEMKTQWKWPTIEPYSCRLVFSIESDFESLGFIKSLLVNTSEPPRIEFSSTFMSGRKTFTMSNYEIQSIRNMVTVYRGLPDALPIFE